MSRWETELDLESRAGHAFRAGVQAAEGTTAPGLLTDPTSQRKSFEQDFYDWGYRLKTLEKSLWHSINAATNMGRRIKAEDPKVNFADLFSNLFTIRKK